MKCIRLNCFLKAAVFTAISSAALSQTTLQKKTGRHGGDPSCSKRLGTQRVSEKRLNAGLRPAKDQRVNVVRALVGVDGFEILRMAHDVVFGLDAVAAMHVA